MPKSNATKAGKFSKEEIYHIRERDNNACIICHFGSDDFIVKEEDREKNKNNFIENTPHHVVFKSHMGLGVPRNGVTICRDCHNMGHNSQEEGSAATLFQLCFIYLSSFYPALTIDLMTFKKGRD